MPDAGAPQPHPFLSAGFRPFFLLGAFWAALAMALWTAMLAGGPAPPTAFGPVDWHAHELIFGYGSAVVAGFLLTAVPNWTGRLPVRGAPLGALALTWLAGRAAVTLGGGLPPGLVAALDLAFLAGFAALVAREIVAGRNTRNLPVLGLCLLLLAGNAAFHWQVGQGGASSGASARTGVAALVLLISLIGGRIVPSFTRNWLAQRGPGPLPVLFNRADAAVVGLTAAALAAWVAAPERAATGAALVLVGAAHVWRLARWTVWRTLAEPLVWVLHAGYAFLPLGFLLLGAAALSPGVPAAAGLHGFLAGGVGVMTLAMMTRASLGHTGRPLSAGAIEVLIYTSVIAAALARLAAAFGGPPALMHGAAALWCLGFALFAATYWPVLTGPRAGRKAPSRAARPVGP